MKQVGVSNVHSLSTLLSCPMQQGHQKQQNLLELGRWGGGRNPAVPHETLHSSYTLSISLQPLHISLQYNTQHDPPYWRGAIWLNMNYLCVRALYYYGNSDGPYRTQARELYEQLRWVRLVLYSLEYEYQLIIFKSCKLTHLTNHYGLRQQLSWIHMAIYRHNPNCVASTSNPNRKH